MATIGGGWPTGERQVTGVATGSGAGDGDLRGGGDERGRRGRQVRRTPPGGSGALLAPLPLGREPRTANREPQTAKRKPRSANREAQTAKRKPRTATGGNRNCRTPRWGWSASRSATALSLIHISEPTRPY